MNSDERSDHDESWVAEIFVTGDPKDIEAWFDQVTEALDDGPVRLSAAGLAPNTDDIE